MQSALITGASSGFGLNVALRLAEMGWRVFASMRNTTKGDALMDRAAAAGTSDRISIVRLDVTNPASVESGVGAVLEATGGSLDALLNNAGYSILGAFEDFSDADCRRQMETNFFGAVTVTRAVLPCMRKAGRGRIVNVSSNAVNSPHPLLTMYAASKWALEGWSEGLAMELAPFGVDVVVIQPGAHRTPFGEHVVPIMPEASAYKQWVEHAMPGIGNLDRWGRDPDKATAPIIAAITDPTTPFRVTVGEDAVAFSLMKGFAPYELRAWALRAIVGLPAPGAWSGSRTAATGQEDESVQSQVAQRLLEAVRDDASIAGLAVDLLARAPTAVR